MVSSPNHMATAKRALRAEMRTARRRACRAAPRAAEQMAERFLAAILIPADAMIAGYWPTGSEIDPRPLMNRLAALGHRLCLPAVEGPSPLLAFHEWRPGDRLVADALSLSTTSGPLTEPNVILAPLLAVDDQGYRLGQGGGHYDVTVATLRRSRPVRVIGLAYAAQRRAVVPREAHDLRLDSLVTEAGVEDFLPG